jgi:hypothetical protein
MFVAGIYKLPVRLNDDIANHINWTLDLSHYKFNPSSVDKKQTDCEEADILCFIHTDRFIVF